MSISILDWTGRSIGTASLSNSESVTIGGYYNYTVAEARRIYGDLTFLPSTGSTVKQHEINSVFRSGKPEIPIRTRAGAANTKSTKTTLGLPPQQGHTIPVRGGGVGPNPSLLSEDQKKQKTLLGE
jgi:hypothetical protein